MGTSLKKQVAMQQNPRKKTGGHLYSIMAQFGVQLSDKRKEELENKLRKQISRHIMFYHNSFCASAWGRSKDEAINNFKKRYEAVIKKYKLYHIVAEDDWYDSGA